MDCDLYELMSGQIEPPYPHVNTRGFDNGRSLSSSSRYSSKFHQAPQLRQDSTFPSYPIGLFAQRQEEPVAAAKPETNTAAAAANILNDQYARRFGSNQQQPLRFWS